MLTLGYLLFLGLPSAGCPGVIDDEVAVNDDHPAEQSDLKPANESSTPGHAAILPFDPQIPLLQIEPITDEEALNLTVDPPSMPQTGATILCVVGLTALLTGTIGWITTPTCITRDQTGDCTGLGQPEIAYTLMIVLGSATAISSYAWMRRDSAP